MAETKQKVLLGGIGAVLIGLVLFTGGSDSEEPSTKQPFEQVGYFKDDAGHRIFTIKLLEAVDDAAIQAHASGLPATQGRMTAAYFYPKDAKIPADGVTLAKNVDQANRAIFGLGGQSHTFVNGLTGKKEFVNCSKEPGNDLCKKD